MHRLGKHQPAGLGIVRRFANDDARLVRLTVRRTRNEIFLSNVYEVRDVVPGLQCHQRLEKFAGSGDFCGCRRNRRNGRRRVLRLSLLLSATLSSLSALPLALYSSLSLNRDWKLSQSSDDTERHRHCTEHDDEYETTRPSHDSCSP